jgi:hypothetical protein
MRSAWAVGLIGLALLGGCGGGGDSRVSGALDKWAGAARAFDSELKSCGTRVYPTRGFFKACMTQQSLGYPSAAVGVRRAFDARAGSSDACRRAAATAGRLLTRDTSLMSKEIAFSDDLNNAATDRQNYSGPPLAQFEAEARSTIDRDLASLRKLGKC